MRTLMVAAVTVISAMPAIAAETIRCIAPGQPDVFLSLDATRMLGRTVSCIAGDFIADMTSCAPRGAFGLSAPTGRVPLVEIVTPAQGYADHFGGVIGYFVDGSALKFMAGFHSFAKDELLHDSWQFTLDRTTGKGVLRLNKDAPAETPALTVEEPEEHTYTCRPDKRKKP
jgi:hypothetical protein